MPIDDPQVRIQGRRLHPHAIPSASGVRNYRIQESRVDLIAGSSEHRAPGLTYVAVSRVKRISHIIMFETPFDMQRFKIGSNQTVENRALDWAYRTRQWISPMYVAPVA